MGFFSRIKKIFGAPSQAEEQVAKESASEIQQEPEQLSEQQHEQQAAQMAELEIREPVQPEGAQQRQEEAAEKPASPETEQAGDVPQQTQIVSAEEGGAEEEKEKPLSAESVIQPVEEAKPAMEKSEDADKKGEASVSPEDASEVSEEVVEVREVAEPAEAAKPAAALDPWAAFKPAEEAKEAPEPEQVTEEIEPAARPEAGAQKSEGTDEKPEGIGAQETEQKAGDKAAEAVEPVKAAIDPWAAFRPAEEAKEAFEPEQVTEESEPAVRYEAGAQKSEGTEEKFEAPEAGLLLRPAKRPLRKGKKSWKRVRKPHLKSPVPKRKDLRPQLCKNSRLRRSPCRMPARRQKRAARTRSLLIWAHPSCPRTGRRTAKRPRSLSQLRQTSTIRNSPCVCARPRQSCPSGWTSSLTV